MIAEISLVTTSPTWRNVNVEEVDACRAARLAASPPGPDWTGVTVATEK